MFPNLEMAVKFLCERVRYEKSQSIFRNCADCKRAFTKAAQEAFREANPTSGHPWITMRAVCQSNGIDIYDLIATVIEEIYSERDQDREVKSLFTE